MIKYKNMTTKTIKEKQPAGLYLLSLTEMWERFSFYAARGLLILYLVEALKFEQGRASTLFGTFTSLTYLLPLLGGFVADKYWGQKKAIVFGAVLIIFGQIVLGLEQVPLLYPALITIALGIGFLKPNVSSVVGDLYTKNDARRDGGFTIFYMGINLGAFLCNLIAGTLGEKVGWRYGFWTAALAMIIGLVMFLALQKKYIAGIGNAPKKIKKDEQKEQNTPLTKSEIKKIAVIFILAFFSVFFWTAYEQSGASLNIFAYQYTQRNISFFGHSWEVPATWFQSLAPMYIILLAPLFSKLWLFLAKKGKDPSTPMKFVIGLWLLGIGYGFMVIASILLGPGVKIGMYFLGLTYLFHVLGELCLSPVGLSMVTKLSPARFVSLLMGVWFLSNALANKLAGTYSSYFGKIDNVYFFGGLLFAPLAAGFVLLLLKKTLNNWMNAK